MRHIYLAISVLLLLSTNVYAQWGQPSLQYQQVCGIPGAPPCPSQYPQYQQPPPQYYGYPSGQQPAYPQQNYDNSGGSGRVDGACMGRCTGQGGSWAQCQRVCN